MPAADEAKDPVRVLLSLMFWAYMALSCPVFFVLAVLIFVVTLPFDRRRAILHQFTCFWGYHYVALCPFWTVRIEGRHNIPRGPSVMVANHQSMGDILVLFGLYRHYKWVSKAAIFKVPFIGWNMTLNDYVRLVRGDAESIASMMEACRRHLRRGSAIMMFPEGTRSVDGQLKAFKHGAFTLADEFEVPVVPIVVDGTLDALPKSGWIFQNKGRIEVLVRVLEPIDTGSMAGPNRAATLNERTRGLMRVQLQAIRQWGSAKHRAQTK